MESEASMEMEKKKPTEAKKKTPEEEEEEKEKKKLLKAEEKLTAAKAALTELQMSKGDKTQQGNDVQKDEQDLRQMMDIPAECWLQPDKSLRGVLEKQQPQMAIQKNSEAKPENLPDKEFLRWASGGLALQGIYQTDKLPDLLGKREQLIQVPDGFELFCPTQGMRFEKMEFSSSEAESAFKKTVEHLGFSFGLSAKVGYWAECAESRFGYTRSSESKKTSRSQSEHAYICTTEYNYIPLASCYFMKDQLRLSDSALQELKNIERLLRLISDNDKANMLKSWCENFFNRFGSHVNQGPLHFGGIFWWRASSEGFKAEKREEMKKQTLDALSFFVQGSHAFPIGSVGLDGKGSKRGSSASTESAHRQAFHTAVQLSVTTTGGPPDVDSLAPWKSGLLASNKSWSIIDQGEEFISVWDIALSNHKKDFEDVLEITKGLQDSYVALTGKKMCTALNWKELSIIEEETRAFLEGLKEWRITGDKEKIVELVNFKKKLYNITKSDYMWVHTCLSDQVLQNFLKETTSLYKSSMAPNISHNRFLLRCLLDPHIYTVSNFPNASMIMKWIFATEEKQQKAVSVTTLDDFTRILQQIKSSIQEAALKPTNSAAAMQEAVVKVSTDLSSDLCSLLNVLRNSFQKDIGLLLLPVAYSVGYHVENNFFQYLLGSPEIEFMLNQIKATYEKYLAVCDQDAYRAQACLLLMGLKISVDGNDLPPDEKKKRLAFMDQYMQPSWEKEAASVLRKHDIRNNWDLLERDLAYLVEGNFEATNDEHQKEAIVRELKCIFQESNPTGNTECKRAQDSTQDRTCNDNTNHEFLNLIKTLGLEKYYPNKMQMTDFHFIHNTSLYGSQPSTESELPLYFLEKLLMLDYRARYLVCKDNIKPDNVSNFADDANKPLDDLDYIFSDVSEEHHEAVQSSQKHVHPMDVQMAIFLCADDFTRQYIATKLSICQFALPLLVPEPCTSQIEFPLWSFGQVNKKWKCVEELLEKRFKKCKDELIYQATTPVVSFIRFGTSLSSKSQLLNNLLSKQKHNIFFHRHCKGSSKNCLLMKGVVEIAWYCPGGDDDTFDTCTAFTNLHGNAMEHEQQVRFLQEVSSVTVILLSESDRNGDAKSFLKELLKSPQPLIFLCVDKEQIFGNRHKTRIRIAVKNRNEAELIEELRQGINDALKVSNMVYSLEKCAPIARKYGFLVDEDKEECRTGKTMAENLVSILKKENILEAKSKLLPLQGSLWHKWCAKDREQTHLQDHKSMGLEQQISQINSAKQTIRHDQLKQAFPLNDCMKLLLMHLNSSSHSIKMYFLQWLKIFIADLASNHLAELQETYHELWTQKQAGDSSELLSELSHKISESTFGLEHLLREVGQLYEALDVSSPQENCVVQLLPQIAADLMESGYPIELMDGDASHVPLKWISSIFDKLAEKLGDKEVFVLSVLGIQSSGKSTLLNAMFGLQFTVSPGRCTKGAFMQLVKVSDKLRPMLKFDFLLIVDTEGLQAMELENRSTFNHDNELATFVIGFGNMTVVNIFGENPSEMQDVLQIAVQAFLRMKMVNLSPRCLFVHQNVGEITTEEKNRESRRCIQKNLDEMTVTAAQQESCDVSCFSDVIQFDVNSHVHYFPHLWEGEPPMAPPNPSYSQKVQELKCKILIDAKEKSQRGLLKISELKTHTRNLWEALLNETFVFSFKNTLEIAVYSELENKYSKWTWELRSFMLDLHHKLNIQIQNEKIHCIERLSLEENIQSKYAATMDDLEKYFSDDRNSKLLIQWKEKTKIKIECLKEELINSTYQNCEKLINLKNRQRSFEERKSTYKDELLRISKVVALQFRNKELSESELRDRFDNMWKEWIAAVSPPVPHAKHFTIQMDVERFLCEYFSREHGIGERIKESAKWTRFPADPRYITVKKTEFGLSKPAHKTTPVFNSIITLTQQLEKLIGEYIKKKEEIMNYCSSYFHEIVEIINETISKSEDTHLTVTPSYRVDVSFYLCQMAARQFTEMYQAFQRENDPSCYLESKREEFFKSFVISCQGAKSITMFAAFVCNHLHLAIRDAVFGKTALSIVNKIKAEDPALNSNRDNLERYMLFHLAEQENFDKYMEYIYNPSYYIGEFIRKRVDKYCLGEQNQILKNILKSYLGGLQELICQAIDDSTQIVEDKGGNVSLWLDEFCSRLEDDLAFPRHTMSTVEHQEVTDIGSLKEAMNDSLSLVLRSLEQTFMETDLEPFFVKPHEILLEQLCGCLKQCPFCKAICTNTIPNHDGTHSTRFHRPQALTGIQWEGTNHFVTDICSNIVASDSTFIFDGKRIPCKQYQTAGSNYAKWLIQRNASLEGYWKWFVCHFRTELEKTYKGVFEGKGAIPREWENISKVGIYLDIIGDNIGEKISADVFQLLEGMIMSHGVNRLTQLS
ncbi:interferon-induced very large GTPase 1-like [Rhineura floridana]|uniref:interferon-induced very large GTPase 1-like n=1 Tax=Rhineura floridana TaxID=261503 RepID=UPI002AC819B0|nr:interferon-induced very large GTPase 1-like [Rhineura floridana]XP_061481882.1 interferon-induced very large GTPase 1-like [Rhineura floridana]